jgi:hypothetical protein
MVFKWSAIKLQTKKLSVDVKYFEISLELPNSFLNSWDLMRTWWKLELTSLRFFYSQNFRKLLESSWTSTWTSSNFLRSWQSFKTSPSLHPPKLQSTWDSKKTSVKTQCTFNENSWKTHHDPHQFPFKLHVSISWPSPEDSPRLSPLPNRPQPSPYLLIYKTIFSIIKIFFFTSSNIEKAENERKFFNEKLVKDMRKSAEGK